MKGNPEMSPFYYVLSMLFLFGTPLVIFAMKYMSSAYQARMRAQADDAYRDLAQRCAQTQSESAASLSAIQGDVSQISARLTAIEKILKAVE
jgi:Mg2+ and Co2+ transporter CorA